MQKIDILRSLTQYFDRETFPSIQWKALSAICTLGLILNACAPIPVTCDQDGTCRVEGSEQNATLNCEDDTSIYVYLSGGAQEGDFSITNVGSGIDERKATFIYDETNNTQKELKLPTTITIGNKELTITGYSTTKNGTALVFIPPKDCK